MQMTVVRSSLILRSITASAAARVMRKKTSAAFLPGFSSGKVIQLPHGLDRPPGKSSRRTSVCHRLMIMGLKFLLVHLYLQVRVDIKVEAGLSFSLHKTVIQTDSNWWCWEVGRSLSCFNQRYSSAWMWWRPCSTAAPCSPPHCAVCIFSCSAPLPVSLMVGKHTTIKPSYSLSLSLSPSASSPPPFPLPHASSDGLSMPTNPSLRKNLWGDSQARTATFFQMTEMEIL